MPQIKVQCPNAACGKVLAVDEGLAGKKGRCSTCGTVFQIPAALGGKPAPASESSARPRSNSPKSPTKPASASKSDRGSRGPAPADRKPAPDRSPGRRPDARRKPAAPADAEFLDAEFLEEDPAFTEDPPRRRAASPAARRCPADEELEDYEDYEDYGSADFEDGDGADYGRPARRSAGRSRGARTSRRGPSDTQRWRRVSVGMLIVAISMCVFAGAVGFLMLAELLMEVAVMNAASAAASGGGGGDALSMLRASETIYKTGRVAASISLAVGIGGCVFFAFAPARHGAVGFGVATLVTGSGWFIIDLVFRTLRAFELTGGRGFRGKVPYETQMIAVFPGQMLVEAGDKVLAL
ncbi:MAG TPA: hypothetical protein VML55_05005, partial [Planctomycetaceae bacterium]|nr:hypothetical protein [Planctomycetaceae bacterium]